MEEKVEVDQFSVLEGKVESLIKGIVSLKEGKAAIEKQKQELDRINADLVSEIAGLKKSKEEARVKVESLLAKIEDLDI